MDMRTLGKKGPVLKSGFVCNTVLPNQWVGKKIIPSSMMECDGWQQLVISPCHGDHIARSVSVLAPGPAEGVSGSSLVPLPPLTADLISKAGLGRPRGVLLAVRGGGGRSLGGAAFSPAVCSARVFDFCASLIWFTSGHALGVVPR